MLRRPPRPRARRSESGSAACGRTVRRCRRGPGVHRNDGSASDAVDGSGAAGSDPEETERDGPQRRAGLPQDRPEPQAGEPVALAAPAPRARRRRPRSGSTPSARSRPSRPPRWRRRRPRSAATCQPSAGTPILTASGYVVARRKAVVSAKIQGRLSELRVEEGSVVREGEIDRPPRVDRLRGGGAARRGRGAAGRGRPRRVRPPAEAGGGPHGAEDRGRGPARRRGEPGEDRRGRARPGAGRPRLRRGPARRTR